MVEVQSPTFQETYTIKIWKRKKGGFYGLTVYISEGFTNPSGKKSNRTKVSLTSVEQSPLIQYSTSINENKE